MRTTWLERISVGSTIALLTTGTWFGFTVDPAWLNRYGSLIIVVGVVVAAIKLKDILGQQIAAFVQKNEPAQLEQLYDAYEKFGGGKLDPNFKENLTKAVRAKTAETFSSYIEQRVARVKRVEISVIVFGTLVNGFGDWAINLVLAAISSPMS